jgi:hypothetical protein
MVLRGVVLLLYLACSHAVPINDPELKPTLDNMLGTVQAIQTQSQVRLSNAAHVATPPHVVQMFFFFFFFFFRLVLWMRMNLWAEWVLLKY